ncbi:transmembrane protein [Dictyostelium discoideum AX4]|uniref:Transmembrane protein n=1 Tax=Dictyostelium discoideum TaxID=44689 RepID=Q86KL3_DICDI|nr:transmembrane protein [Dictyostelium discoideum AX4]EAL71478.1 transmembrane protein [Dictyostelium discoideum AX4]|eukprot:XP_645414.1 transmembrane protein [Dictyostelium discoideum AX4]
MKNLLIYLLIILIINYVNGLSIEHDLILKQQQQEQSRHQHCKIGKYDFSGFKKEKGSYEFKSKKLNELGEEIDVEYYFNICSGSSKCDNSLISVCSRDNQFNDIVYGETSNLTLAIGSLKENTVEGGILTYYAPSNKCGASGGIMKTTISMYCAKGQPNTVISVVNRSPNNCNLEIAIMGDSACESKVDVVKIYLFLVSALLVLLIITLITCTILYFIDKKKKLSMGYSKLSLNTTPGNDS